jgi:hypothetical protein
MIPDPAPPYEVGMSDNLREHIGRLSERAASLGIGAEFRDAVREVFEALRQDPHRAGDPIRKLRGLKMTEYRLVRDQLIVNYSVHDRIPMVTVWRFVPTSGHPLAPPDKGN